MKWILGGLLLMTLVGTASAEAGAASNIRQRLAAASDACLASCSSNNASCKRVCPTTFGTPCLASCDSQYQTCVQSCQNR
jgi:hypothetical protein